MNPNWKQITVSKPVFIRCMRSYLKSSQGIELYESNFSENEN